MKQSTDNTDNTKNGHTEEITKEQTLRNYEVTCPDCKGTDWSATVWTITVYKCPCCNARFLPHGEKVPPDFEKRHTDFILKICAEHEAAGCPSQ